MNHSEVHKNNATWWNENAVWYAERDIEEDIAFLRSGGIYLFDRERELLGDLSPWCQRAIHLQCSHGRDALSLINMGAGEVVGVDISERNLAAARRKSDALGARATWICSDILETPHELDGTADLVYTGNGAVCWMMDLPAWARVIARLLKPGGRFFIHEGHPLDWVWNCEANGYVLDEEQGDYFSEKFCDRLFSHPTQSKPQYRQWTLASIVNSVIDAGLAIEKLMEYPEPFWNQFGNMPEVTLRRLPHTFAILARKPEG